MCIWLYKKPQQEQQKITAIVFLVCDCHSEEASFLWENAEGTIFTVKYGDRITMLWGRFNALGKGTLIWVHGIIKKKLMPTF